MKPTIKLLTLALAVLGASSNAGAAVSFGALDGLTYTASSGPLSQLIPDNNLSGVSYSLNFAQVGAALITGMSVSFTTSGGNNGDMYAYLAHGSSFVVLVNRIGRGAATPDGSAASGFSTFTLDSTVSLLTDAHAASGTAGAALGGAYAPDGRYILPTATAAAFDSTTRDATFATLLGSDPNGGWTLFFADAAAGGSLATLTSFSVVATVPEPVTWALMVFGTGFGAVQLGRYCRRRASAG